MRICIYYISNLRSIKHPNVITVSNLAQIYIPIIGMAGNIYNNINNIGTSIYVILFFVWYLHFFHGNIATYKDKKINIIL